MDENCEPSFHKNAHAPHFFPLVQMSGGITDNPKSMHETAEGPQIPCESLHPTVGAVTGSQILNSWMEIAW